MLKGRSGFTLLELAIVLVIIGIILGAILKGQELINNAKTKRLLNDMKGLAAIQYSFYDRYGRFAGDCNADGSIDYNYLMADITSFQLNPSNLSWCYDPTNPQAQGNPDKQWEELVKAQFFPPAGNARDLVKHSFNGALYSASWAQNNGPSYNAIVATQVPCYAAKTIDQSIDGSIDATKGSIRKITGNDTLETNAANSDWACQNESDLVGVIYFFDRRPQ